MQGVHKWISWVKNVWRLSKQRKENILIYTHTHADNHVRIKNIVLESEVYFCVLNLYSVAVLGKHLILKQLILKCNEERNSIVIVSDLPLIALHICFPITTYTIGSISHQYKRKIKATYRK